MDACQRAISVTATISQTGCLRTIHVGYGAYNGLKSDTATCPKSATTSLMHRSNDEAMSSFRQAGGLQSPGWLSHRRVLGLSLEGEFPEDACRVEGSSKANFFFARQ